MPCSTNRVTKKKAKLSENDYKHKRSPVHCLNGLGFLVLQAKMFQKAIAQYNKQAEQPFAPKVVLFDMDGVLYNSMPNHAKAWQRAMAEFGINFTAEDAYATEGARGVDTVRKYAKVQLGKELTEDEAEEMYQLKAHYFHEMPTTDIFDGVKDLMQKIQDSGLKIGIVTGSGQRQLINRLLSDFKDFINEKYDGAVIPFDDSADTEDAAAEETDSKDTDSKDEAKEDAAEENAETTEAAEDAE